MTSLVQEIISVYTLLNPSQLTAAASNRVCNALALLQCVASHNDTRTLFLNGTSFLTTLQLCAGADPTQPISLCTFILSLTLPPSRVLSNTFDSQALVSSVPWSRTIRQRSSTSS